MLWAAAHGNLELRSEGGATRLRATFPYGAQTELAPGRFEVIAARAFAPRLDAGEDIHLLFAHDYDRPLASTRAGNLRLTDTDRALELEAEIDAGTSWAHDFIAAHRAGLIRGLSPGFMVEPDGERITRNGDGILRTITRAQLFEASAVTVPAYPQAQIAARAWSAPSPETRRGALAHARMRWRA